MSNYLDKELNEAIEQYAIKKAAQFQPPPKSIKEQLDEMDRKREARKRFAERFFRKKAD